MATFRLEFDEHGEPLLVEEGNCSPTLPVNEWIERFLGGADQWQRSAATEPEAGKRCAGVSR